MQKISFSLFSFHFLLLFLLFVALLLRFSFTFCQRCSTSAKLTPPPTETRKSTENFDMNNNNINIFDIEALPCLPCTDQAIHISQPCVNLVAYKVNPFRCNREPFYNMAMEDFTVLTGKTELVLNQDTRKNLLYDSSMKSLYAIFGVFSDMCTPDDIEEFIDTLNDIFQARFWEDESFDEHVMVYYDFVKDFDSRFIRVS